MLDAEFVRRCDRARLPISWYQIDGGLTVNWTDPSILRAAIDPRYIRLVEPKSPYSPWRSARPPGRFHGVDAFSVLVRAVSSAVSFSRHSVDLRACCYDTDAQNIA